MQKVLILAIVSVLGVHPYQYEKERAAQPTVFLASKSSYWKDTDKDFLSDADEKNLFHTNPLKKDTNGNGVFDGDEDSDNNGFANEDEDDRKKSRKKLGGNRDRDNDGLQDEDEDDWGMSPKKADSDGNGILDGDEDTDGNGILNKDEDNRRKCTKKNKNRCTKTPTSTPRATPSPQETLLPPPTATVAPTTTPKPSATATSAPTATATPSSGNFDSNGNVTSTGKQLFGIPSALSANVTKGKSVFDSNCVGCHSEKTNRSYTTYDSVLPRSPMFITLTSQEIADLTAYLNRSRK